MLFWKLVTVRPLWVNQLSRRPLSSNRKSDQDGVMGTNKQNVYNGPIVISGVSGRFPSADSMKVLTEKLFDKVDMTSETTMRWTKHNQPKRFGFILSLDKFDAEFFGMTARQANQLDPQMRLLLESSFEALIDAGMNPTAMRGSRTGVFSGAYGGESIDYNLLKPNKELVGYYGLLSMNFMIPARISFTLDFRGPSFHMCTACSSSFTALEGAVNAIMLGNCEAAIVTGSTVHLNPGHMIDALEFGALSPDGHCKAFDESADGFARAEAAVSILVQKEKDAKRSYARILNIRSNIDGFKHEGIMFPNGHMQEQLLRDTYNEAGVDPASVSLIEAHGTGTPSGDPQELEAIGRVFMDGRAKSLLLGSVKSNLGHTEAAAGLCSIAKTVIAIQSGNIAPNLHFNRPKPEQEHLFEGGGMKVVTDVTPFDGGLVGISSFGIGGTNYHCILEPGATNKNASVKHHDLPVIIPFAGRSEEIVDRSIKEASEHAKINQEYAFLLQSAYSQGITGYPWRGYGILDNEGTNVVVENSDITSRSVWIVFPGMGSQWNEMGKDLMKIGPFAESIQRSRVTLKNLGIQLDELLKPNNQAIFDDIHNAVLSITTMQIALYDTTKALGVVPEGFIGHSTGEFLCAYADDCFTAEETLLVTDARGRAFKESQKVRGCMASIGMSAEEVKKRLPPGVELACNNAAQNVTVSGEKEAVTSFVHQLKYEGKFAVVVNSCGIAAHSVHVQDAADLLKKYVADLIKGERVRSERWISTSVPEHKWNSPMAKAASPEYFDNNLRAPVLFYEALQHVPPKALVVEVSPKGFFQALLKESVPSDCVHVAPMTVKAEDKLSHFFHSVGRMYLSGVDIHMNKLYPQLQLPVSSDVPFLGPLVQWDHGRSWKTSVLHYPLESGLEHAIDLEKPNCQYLAGHKLEDRIIFPATGYLRSSWMHVADVCGQDVEKTPVIFSDVIFKRATVLAENKQVTLFYTTGVSTGRFEVQEGGDVVVTGVAQRYSGPPVGLEPLEKPTSQHMPLNKQDIYKELRLRGYNYSGVFQGITKTENEGHWAEVEWTGNWISFLDTILQTVLLTTTSRNLAVPVDFETVIIDPVEFKKHLKEPEPGQEYPSVRVTVNRNQQTITCPGILIKNVQATIVPKKGHRENLAYEKYEFYPYNESSKMSVETHLWEIVDLVLENNPSKELKVTDVFTKKENSLAKSFRHILTLKPLRESDLRMLTLETEAEKMSESEMKNEVLLLKQAIQDLVPETVSDLVFLDTVKLIGAVAGTLKPSGFLLVHSKESLPEDTTNVLGLVPISTKILVDKTLALYRKAEYEELSVVQITVDKDDFSWVSDLQDALKKPVDEASRIYITSQNQPISGVMGLVNCLRQEEGGDRIRCLFDPESKINLDFASPDDTLMQILKRDLAMTVVKKGHMGSYRHTPLKGETNQVVKTVEHAYVSTLTPGDLTSLRWIESPLGTNVSKGGQLYNIVYAAMNFRDVLLATATIPIQPESSYESSYMGYEFSGFDEKGNRVMGITNGASIATSVVTDSNFVWPVPDHWTLEEAATVPVAYATVLCSLHMRCHIQPRQKILIHAGTGGVGQAAISVALAHGCEVFTTVGTPEKREFIKKHFPQIQDDHIGNSRDTSFEAQFMEVTKGKGVDVVLNSLADDKLKASIRCLATNGKFIEIGVYDAFKNTPLGMRPFLKNIDFCGFELYHVMAYGAKNAEAIKNMVDAGITSGAIRPLPSHVFPKTEVEEAFRFMASGKHMGKLLIKVRYEEKPEAPLNLPAIGRCYFPEEEVYIIVGGVGGLGMELANWMVERGARNVILTSRSGVTTGYQSLCIRKWAELGVIVETPVIDLSNKEVAETFIKDISSKHSIGGIFNSALVLQDDAFPNQDPETFKQVCAPKATITEYLDQLTRKYCPKMDYFVVFSSSACGRGNAEQTNYGWANSVMERICENRVADGLHGLAIQWGVVGQAGVVAEKILKNMDGTEVLMGTLPQNVDSCLEVLDAALQQSNPLVSSIVVAEKGKKKGDKAGLLARMAKIFGTKDIESLPANKKLTELGMDSLVRVELKQTLEREYDIAVTKELVLSLTVGDLRAMDTGTFSVDKIGAQNGQNSSSTERMVVHQVSFVRLESAGPGKSIVMVHGLQGDVDTFKPLASRLHTEVDVFQLATCTDIQSITKISEQYIEELKKVHATGPYTICGYSAGGVIAHEMAIQLEDKYRDEIECLILLDGPPSFENPNVNAGKLFGIQAAEALGFFGGTSEDVKKKFEDSLTGDMAQDFKMYEKLGEAASVLNVNMNVFRRYIDLISALQLHVPSKDYVGQTVHIEASSSVLHVSTFGEDYNVSKRCKGPVARHKVSGDHVTFLQDEHVDETARILSKLLVN